MRKLPLALACALIFGSSSAFAMGLGELQTQSNLNQPLRVMIPITDVRPGDVDALSVKIGDEAQFARHGYSLVSVYGRIKLQIVGGQRPHILLTTDMPVRDPVLGLVLEVDGPSGTIERAVSILLDPEGYKPLAVVKSASGRASVQDSVSDMQPRDQIYATERPSTQRSPAPAQALPPIKDGGSYTAVSGDTAYNIAQRVKPDGVSLQQTIGMILQNNPQAFANPADANTLLAGKTLTIPNAQAMRQAAPVAVVAPKVAPAGATPAAPAAAQDPRLDIVQPTTPAVASVPVVAAPVVGEVVSGGTAGAPSSTSTAVSQAAPQAAVIPAEVQEQLEASKVENERLTGLLASQDQRLQKMEELLRLNETLIKEMEQKMKAAPAAAVAPVAAPVEASAPWWSYGLIGLGALLAAVLAYVVGSRRRPKDEPESAAVQPVSSVTLDKQAETEANVAAPVVASPVAMPVAAAAANSVAVDVIEDSADSIKAALEEADVMQAYGLHDRAIQVLSDALQAQPGNAVLMARHARAMHEAGDAEGFLNEAEAFRKQHPGEEAHWAELRALGEAHYPSSPLFAAAVLDDELNPWAQPSVVFDEASALTQPLESLDLGVPENALDELLGSQAGANSLSAHLDRPPLDLDLPLELDLPAVSDFTKAASDFLPALEPIAEANVADVQSSSASLDMPPLDLPAVSNITKASDDIIPALDAAAEAKIADLTDDWAPLELPSTVNAQPALDNKDAAGAGSAFELSEDDLAILGIDTQDGAVDAFMPGAAGVRFVEPDFAEDMQAAQLEMAALDLKADMEAISLPLADAEAVADKGADESFNIDLMDFEPLDLALVAPSASEPAHDASALSLELESAHTAAASSAIEPLELPLDLPSSAPMSSFQEAVSTPMPSSGMVSEHEVKLDIASAYIDMGDHAGAREMLQEVLASDGDELLKSRAHQMLASLSS